MVPSADPAAAAGGIYAGRIVLKTIDSVVMLVEILVAFKSFTFKVVADMSPEHVKFLQLSDIMYI